MLVLGIETSCDETAASVVKDGNTLLSNVVFSSMDLHKAYGGVVPEVAARSHIESIIPVINQALIEAFPDMIPSKNDDFKSKEIDTDVMQGANEEAKRAVHNGTVSENRSSATQQNTEKSLSNSGFAGIDKSVLDSLWDKIDAIAVTYGAGLGGSLLVGVMTARTLAITKNKPLFAINHVEAHVYANFITSTESLLLATDTCSVDRKSSLDDTLLSAPMLNHGSDTTALSASHNRLVSSQSPAQVREWRLGDKKYLLPQNQPEFPALAIIVSGGHSQLVLFRDHFDYTLLGQTRDDAIGEAFDKVAKITGLPYPGGPSVSKAAEKGDANKYKLPKSKLDNKYEFSFSGLKTAVLRLAQKEIGEDFTFPSHKIPERLSEALVNDIAASFQRTAIETIVDKAVLAFKEFQPKSVLIAGGVAANQELRRQLTDRIPIGIEFPDLKLCTDNGAMVASLGCFKAIHNQPVSNPYSLDINPNLKM